MQPPPPPRLQRVIDAFQRLDRRAVAALVAQELAEGPPAGDHWANVEAVANRIGEIDAALECARRYAATSPRTLDRALHYCHALASRGRTEACQREVEALPAAVRQHPDVVRLRGSLASRAGDFAQAAELARQAIALEPMSGRHWWSLAQVHKFSAGDRELQRLEELASRSDRTPAPSQAAFRFALGKARHDCGDYDRAFESYEQGAHAMRAPFDITRLERHVREVTAGFTRVNLATLTPSGCASDRAIFVTGLPRSGTTLVEQILAAHSAVEDGEEANLFCSALIPAGDFSWRAARDYQQRAGGTDPWGELGRDYLSMLAQRFGPHGRIVDKTLNHSHFLGLILQALPEARVVWLRRDPEDTAISCFRAFFDTATIPWCWSLADIANYFRLDDALHAHWSAVYPDRILTVAYESLVSDSAAWIPRILAHVGLEPEPAVFSPHEKRRSVLTASIAQVREPISAASIGTARKYQAHLQPFRDAYGVVA